MTPNEVRSLQERMVTLLLINLLIAAIIPQIFSLYGGMLDLLLAFAVGFVILTLADLRYGRVVFWTTVFLIYLFWEMILANIALAWLILQPKPDVHPAIVAIPLRVSTGLEITMIATAITLTPATLSLDLAWEEGGRPILYVHALRVKDPDQLRTQVRDGFERLVLLIMRGTDR